MARERRVDPEARPPAIPGAPRPRRLFIAVELPDEVLRAVAAIGDALRRHDAGRGARWVDPHTVHLTLKFIGSFDGDQLPALESALQEVAAAQPRFDLRTGQLGGFGSPARLRVLWLGLAGDLGRCAFLAEALDRATAGLGVERADRPFAPHLTLARIGDRVPPADRRRLGALIAALPPAVPVTLPVERFSLMESWLLPGGARHEALRRFDLAGGIDAAGTSRSGPSA